MAKREVFSSAGGFRVEDSDLNPLIRSIDGTMDSGKNFFARLRFRFFKSLFIFITASDFTAISIQYS